MQKAQESVPAKTSESFEGDGTGAVGSVPVVPLSSASSSSGAATPVASLLSTASMTPTTIYDDRINYVKYTSPFAQVVHFTFAMIAIYMSVRANCGFSFFSFLAACCCPYFYIPYYMALYGFNGRSCPTNAGMNRRAVNNLA